MKKILLLTLLATTTLANISPTNLFAQTFEEKKIGQGVKFQSAEEIINDLKAKKEAEKPFNDKDVKVDLESLGLDDVDRKIRNKTNEVVAKVRESDLMDNTPIDSGPRAPTVPIITRPVEVNQTANSAAIMQNDIQKQIADVTNKIESDKNAAQLKSAGVLSQIKNMFNEDSTETHLDKHINPNPQNTGIVRSTALKNQAVVLPSKKQRKIALRKRLQQERLVAEQRNQLKMDEEKMIKLNRLRDEYLIKVDDELQPEDEDEYKSKSSELLPIQKKYSFRDRFISYDPQPAPILDRYRGPENVHIPLIPTPQEKVELLFTIIKERNDGNPTAFHSAFDYVLNPNVRNQYGETLLTYATLLQKYAIMQSVLTKGADPDLPNALGHTPLDIAIEMLDLKAANLLIANNADVNYVDGYGRNYLMHATRVGFFPMVELFVNNGIDVNAVDNDGYSPLAMAYRHKKDFIVKYLIKNGAQPWTPKNYRPTEQSVIKELDVRWKNPSIKYRTDKKINLDN